MTNDAGGADQVVTRYEYDELGRRVKRTLPGNEAETYGYDALGNLALHTNFNGVVITNQYDVMNRLTNRSALGLLLAAFTYTAGGQRDTMTDPSGVTAYTYDVRERLTTNATPQGTLYYRYDANGSPCEIYERRVPILLRDPFCRGLF